MQGMRNGAAESGSRCGLEIEIDNGWRWGDHDGWIGGVPGKWKYEKQKLMIKREREMER